jgi:hypothetical protein
VEEISPFFIFIVFIIKYHIMRNKFILTEEESKRILSLHSKKIQEERNTISNSLLNEENDGVSYTIPQEYVRFTNSENITANYLKIFKGAKFIPDSKGNLLAKTKIQFTTVLDGVVQSSYNDGDDADDATEQKLYTYDSNLIYNCKEGKMITDRAPGQKYYADTNDSKNVVEKLNGLCRKPKSQKSSYGTEAVGGGLGYTQKYGQPITSQDGKKMTIPKGTGYVPKKDGAGASFRLGNDFGWFDCKTKNFVINKVKYTSDTLSKTLSAKLCKSETPTPTPGGGGGTITPGSKGGGGVGSRYTFDFNTIMKEIDSKCVSKKTPEPEIDTTLSNDTYQTLTSL